MLIDFSKGTSSSSAIQQSANNLVKIVTELKLALAETQKIRINGLRNINLGKDCNANIGEVNYIYGRDNCVKGSFCSIVGNDNTILGDKDTLIAANSRVCGRNNFLVGKKIEIDGNSNIVFASAKTVQGNNLLVIDVITLDLTVLLPTARKTA